MNHPTLPLQAARALERSYSRRAGPRRPPWLPAAELLLYHANRLHRHVRRLERVQRLGWATTAGVQERQAADALHQLYLAVQEQQSEVLGRVPPPGPTPVLRDLHAELLQVQDEFDEVGYEPREHVLWVKTDPIELEDVPLGSFRIELHLDRLSSRADSSVFDVIALSPNPASANRQITHPHVSDRQLCAGEATVPLSQALREGRVCDAFLAVNGVLHTYNPSSPYVRLDQWSGSPCHDCGNVVDDDDRCFCEDCDHDFCPDCFSTCDVCESSCCRGCLEEDPATGRLCCSSCQGRCGRCGRLVASDAVDDSTGLCPACHEQWEEEQADPQPENPDAEPDPQHDDDPCPAIVNPTSP